MVEIDKAIENWIKENHPEHLDGWNKDWLEVKVITFCNHHFCHVYSDTDGLIGTVHIY